MVRLLLDREAEIDISESRFLIRMREADRAPVLLSIYVLLAGTCVLGRSCPAGRCHFRRGIEYEFPEACMHPHIPSYKEVKLLKGPKFDALLKELFTADASMFFTLVSASPIFERLDPQLQNRTETRADLLLRLRDDSLLHVEFQTSDESLMIWRMLDYYRRISLRHPKRDVRQIVVYLGSDHSSMIDSIEHDHLRYDYELVNIIDYGSHSKKLLKSDSVQDRILGLLCMDTVRVALWFEVARYLAKAPRRTLEENFWRFAVAASLRDLPEEIGQEIMNMAVMLDLEAAPTVSQFLDVGGIREIVRLIKARAEAQGIAWSDAYDSTLRLTGLDAVRDIFDEVYLKGTPIVEALADAGIAVTPSIDF